jgi:lysozyme family protein
MKHPFLAVEQEYKTRLASLTITRRTEVHNRALSLLRPSRGVIANFKPVEEELGIPMVWMICSFERESGMDFKTSPAQGDPWNRVSTHVPSGVGPFKSFTEAAIWSYKHDGLNKNSAPWSWPYACWGWEKFNGFGPRDHGRVSGYVFAGTDQYDPPHGQAGKYVADGKWDPNEVDKQLGCVALALELISLDASLALPVDLTVATPDPIPVTPVPVGVGGSGQAGVAAVHDTRWIQEALNKIYPGSLVVDGNYGRMTRNVVRFFQTTHGLDADGLAGPLTVAALEIALHA